jgi:hypothetical protein
LGGEETRRARGMKNLACAASCGLVLRNGRPKKRRDVKSDADKASHRKLDYIPAASLLASSAPGARWIAHAGELMLGLVMDVGAMA